MTALTAIESPAPGLAVFSALGTPGVISTTRPLKNDEVETWRHMVPGELLITIEWENGKTSTYPHSQLDAVKV